MSYLIRHIPNRVAILIGSALVMLLSAGALGACSTSIGGSANIGAVLVTPSSLTLGCSGASRTGTFVATEAGFNGQFTASSSNTSVATVSAGSQPGQFTVTEAGAGSAMITVTGGAGATATVGVTAC